MANSPDLAAFRGELGLCYIGQLDFSDRFWGACLYRQNPVSRQPGDGVVETRFEC